MRQETRKRHGAVPVKPIIHGESYRNFKREGDRGVRAYAKNEVGGTNETNTLFNIQFGSLAGFGWALTRTTLKPETLYVCFDKPEEADLAVTLLERKGFTQE